MEFLFSSNFSLLGPDNLQFSVTNLCHCATVDFYTFSSFCSYILFSSSKWQIMYEAPSVVLPATKTHLNSTHPTVLLSVLSMCQLCCINLGARETASLSILGLQQVSFI